jgi:hypothetical protein
VYGGLKNRYLPFMLMGSCEYLKKNGFSSDSQRQARSEVFKSFKKDGILKQEHRWVRRQAMRACLLFFSV